MTSHLTQEGSNPQTPPVATPLPTTNARTELQYFDQESGINSIKNNRV